MPIMRKYRGGPQPSLMHGTLCRCGREAKMRWQLVGRICWARLPRELQLAITTSRRSKDKDAIQAAERAAIEWLIANPEGGAT